MYGMDGATLVILIVTGLIVGAGIIYLLVYLNNNIFNPTGKGAHRKTRGTLKQFAGIRRFKVLSDVRLEVDGKTATIENMLIGFFGVLLVHTLGARGEYYGTMDGESWHVDLNGKRTTFPNPVQEQKRAEALLRGIFAANKLYKIPVEHILYLTSRSRKTGLFITHGGEILMPGKLGGYLDKTRFEKDIGLDVEAVAKAIAGSGTVGQA